LSIIAVETKAFAGGLSRLIIKGYYY